MSEKSLQETFLDLVDGLKLKSPISRIAEKMGYSTGTVSDYINSNREVSPKFFKKFCSAFEIDDTKIEKSKSVKPDKIEPKDKEALIEQLYGRLKDKDSIIEGLQAQIMYLSQEVERVSKIPDSLGKGEGASINKNVKDA